MNFELSEQQEEYRRRVIDFASSQLDESIIDDDLECRFPEQNWKRCAEFGIHSLSLPSEYTGRSDRDFLTAVIAMEALGYGCLDNGLAFALSAHIWTVQHPIYQYGTDDQRARYLPRLSSGEWIGCHAVSEPVSGSDMFNMQSVAARSEGGYVLNGYKQYILLGPVADLAIVFASTDPPAGKWGITAFLVETSSSGVIIGENRPEMGLRDCPVRRSEV